MQFGWERDADVVQSGFGVQTLIDGINIVGTVRAFHGNHDFPADFVRGGSDTLGVAISKLRINH